MLIGLNEDMTPIDFGFTRLEVKVTMITIVNNVNMISAPYLENCLTQSFHRPWGRKSFLKTQSLTRAVTGSCAQLFYPQPCQPLTFHSDPWLEVKISTATSVYFNK